MNDSDCVAFLQWCLPRLGYRWPGFRRVRRQVCRRVGRRLVDLGLHDLPAYRAHLEDHDHEWSHLDRLCHVTISRFYRDRTVFDRMRDELLPELARRALGQGRTTVDAWSAGCASGEEPYTLRILWRLAVEASLNTRPSLRICATDVDAQLLKRAMTGTYPSSSLTDLPAGLARVAFEESGGSLVLRPRFRGHIDWLLQDVRREAPAGSFDLVLCRNLAFTYFVDSVQSNVVKRIYGATRPNGYLVIGSTERLPAGADAMFREVAPHIFRRRGKEPGSETAEVPM